jgi:glycosyltransferase involved in cell wall biosynthesis
MLKPGVVVMAIYNPNTDWLGEQLRSIEAQEYADIELIAADDASDSITHGEIAEIFRHCLIKTPYKLHRNDENIGSDKTFELLTTMADGYEYISYCDQDDVWLPQKTAELVSALGRPKVSLAYSDLSVIDKDGRQTAASLSHIRRRHRFMEGGGLANTLLFRNFTNGTAMMTRLQTAKEALPFIRDMTADHWLTLWCALNGEIAFVPQPLVKYRLHGSNQSAVMTGVHDKESYLEKRIIRGLSRFEQFKERLGVFPETTDLIKDGCEWFQARKDWFKDAKRARDVWRLRHLGKQVSTFELLSARLPNPIFMTLIRLVQKGII